MINYVSVKVLMNGFTLKYSDEQYGIQTPMNWRIVCNAVRKRTFRDEPWSASYEEGLANGLFQERELLQRNVGKE